MYISGIETRAAWADDLLRKHAPPGWSITFYLPKTGVARRGTFGHAKGNARRIELATSNAADVMEHRWVVLHEIAHAIHMEPRRNASGYMDPRKQPMRGTRCDHHPFEFWRIAIHLYVQYPGVMEYAARHEYKRGRKLISRVLDLAAERIA
jgi:hypothetical protein